MMVEVTQEDREAAAKWAKMQGRPHQAGNMRRGACDAAPLVQAFARHRATAFAAAFADGFTAALQGAEAAIWRIEDDAFLYENVSKALQEVISELQAMEQNWTGRVTIEHRLAAGRAARDRAIVEWLREDHGDWSAAARKFADAIERGEV